MRPFSLLVKPASGDCNLRCDYCFYRGHSGDGRRRMSLATLERIVRTFLATDQEFHSFGWQGGEPTLMGTEFFRAVTGLQVRHGRRGTRVMNGLQTNGTRIDDELAAHLARCRFLVGVSLDGPAGIHDRHRRTASGRPTHERVLRGIRVLRRHGVEFNVVVLVHRESAGRAREIYRWLVDRGILHHQYIPCVEFGADGSSLPFSIDGPAWGAFLLDLFDEWRKEDTRRVSIRDFDSLLLRLLQGRPAVCTMADDCRQYLVVEHDGGLYPCDFFVEERWRLSSVFDTPFEEALASPLFAEFGLRKRRWNAACAACPHVDLCAGGCVRHRGPRAEATERSVLCSGWRAFLDHARGELEALAGTLRREASGA